jgi:hypothetical protein
VVFAKDGVPGLAMAARIGLIAAAILICATLLKMFRQR